MGSKGTLTAVMTATTERRISPRVRAYHPVRMHQPSSPKVIETLTKNVSVGGFSCVSPVLLPVSSRLSVDLVLSAGESSFSVNGRAVWFRVIPHSDQFEIGISFEDLSEKNKQRLSVYLETCAFKAL